MVRILAQLGLDQLFEAPNQSLWEFASESMNKELYIASNF